MITKSEILELVREAFYEGVDETLVTLLTNPLPSKERWPDFKDSEWASAKASF